jgi:hypothetical protein
MATCDRAPEAEAEAEAEAEVDDGVDVTLIRWMLSLSLEDRLAVLQGFADSIAELSHDSPAAKVQRSA